MGLLSGLACVWVLWALLLSLHGAAALECGEGWVQCGDGDECVKKSHVCDGLAYCYNGWDELHCTSCDSYSSFLCDGSRCVYNSHKCDGLAWCLDGSDEDNCTTIRRTPVCKACSRCNGIWGDCDTRDDEVGCTVEMCQAPARPKAYSGGRCRDPGAKCNGELNFPDENDEDCTQCYGGAMFCGGRCIPAERVCDGHADCPDGEDELNCTSCGDFGFICDGSRCVRYGHECDEVTWCRDGSDEIRCGDVKIDRPPYCEASTRCNGLWGDCWTEDDEVDCTPEMCQEPATAEAFSGGRCRDPHGRCNGVLNFPDDKDEDNCTQCNGGAVFCDGTCIPAWDVCDGYMHCQHGEDEVNCTTCWGNSFLCDGSHCFSQAYKCDGVAWCLDGSDEANCTSKRSAPQCNSSSRCNGIWDECKTKDDEVGCTPEMCQKPATAEAFSGGMCRDPDARCNGEVNSPDGKDEDNCTQCNGGALFCGGYCVPPRALCTGIVNCPHGEDQLNCTSCKADSFLCDGSRCVHKRHRCDGVAWCLDGSDEANCTRKRNTPHCKSSSRCNGIWGECNSKDDEVGCTPEMCQAPATAEAFSGGRCRDPDARCNGVVNFREEKDEDDCKQCNAGAMFCNERCIPLKEICDGVADCPHAEDELNCTSCKADSLLCDGSRCVHKKHRCDGVAWCRDGADEANCNQIQSTPYCAASSRCNGVKGDCESADDEIRCTPEMCQAPASRATYCNGGCRKSDMWCDPGRNTDRTRFVPEPVGRPRWNPIRERGNRLCPG